MGIQNKEIFVAMKNGQKLWHLVIDTLDIEFVTPPFASDKPGDKENLEASIHSITQACDILKEEGHGASFENWIGNLSNSLKNSDITILIVNQTVYQKIKSRNLTFKPDWKPIFQPQVTIQHPLELTIPLIISLFNAQSSLSPINIEKLLQAFPGLNDLKQNRKKLKKNNENFKATYFTKSHGLLFLHALTCIGLVSPSHQQPIDQIREIATNFSQFKQVDPKIKLKFLSRRPFSIMWNEIKSESTTFGQAYNTHLLVGNDKFKKLNLAEKFDLINYSEEYCEPNNEARRDLSQYKNLFNHEFA